MVRQAKALGYEVALLGKIGRDTQGEVLRNLLSEEGIGTDLLCVSADVKTSIDVGLVMTHGREVMAVAGTANPSLALADIDLNNPVFDRVAAVYVAGFLKQEALYRDYPTLLASLKQKGARLFMDVGRFPVDTTDEQRKKLQECLPYLDGYFLNDTEIADLTGVKRPDETLARVLGWGPGFVALKLGAEGCRIKSRDEDIKIPGYKVFVANTVAAGDSFNAAFITQLLEGKSLEDCARFANATAAMKVRDNEVPTRSEVEDFIQK